MSAALDRLTAAYYNAGLLSGGNPGGLSGVGAARQNLPLLLADVATVVAEVAANAAAAAASANVAVNAPGTTATSATNIAIGTGAKTIFIQTGKTIQAGMPMIVARTADAANSFMWGIVTGYITGTGQLDILVRGVGPTLGTFNAWSVSVAGPPLNMSTDKFTLGHAIVISGIAYQSFAADQNDYAGFNNNTVHTLRCDSAGAARTLTGFAGGADGRRIRLQNMGALDVILAHNSGASLAANRLYLSFAQNRALRPYQSVELEYHSGVGYWMEVSSFLATSAAAIRTNSDFGGAITPGDLWLAHAGVAVASGTSLTIDAAAGFLFTTTLTHTPTLNNPTNPKVGQVIRWEFTMGAGAGQPTFGSAWKFSGSKAFDTTNGNKTILRAEYMPGGFWDAAVRRNPT